MPGRGHKIASRQAQLGQRRRKQGRPVGNVATRPRPAAPSPAEKASEAAGEPTAVATAPATQPARSSPRSHAHYHPTVLDHIGSELRRIGAVGVTALAVLLVLGTVVL